MTQRQSQVKVLSMQKFAKLCETTPRTIRFYQQQGLLEPSYIDPFTKYRYFRPEQAREVLHIKLLQNFHVPLKEIKQLLKNSSAQSFLEEKVKSVSREIEEKEKELLFLKEIKDFIGEEKITSSLKEEFIGPFTLLCTFVKHGRYDEIEDVTNELLQKAEKLGITTNREGITFYHDPFRYKPNDSPLEIGIMCQKIPQQIVLPSDVYIKEFPRQKVLMYSYKGPFEYLTFIHKRMVEMTKGKKLNGYPFDLTLSGPWNKKSVYDYVTKVGYPVENT